MKVLTFWFYQRATGWIVLGLLAVYIVFPAYLLPRAERTIEAAAGANVKILDLQMGFSSAADYATLLEPFGEVGRAVYRQTELTIDIAYPIVYGLFWAFLIAWLLKRYHSSKPQWHWLVMIPLLGSFSDFIENALIVGAIQAFPNINSAHATILSTFTNIKFAFDFGAILISIILFVMGMVIRRRSAA